MVYNTRQKRVLKRNKKWSSLQRNVPDKRSKRSRRQSKKAQPSVAHQGPINLFITVKFDAKIGRKGTVIQRRKITKTIEYWDPMPIDEEKVYESVEEMLEQAQLDYSNSAEVESMGFDIVSIVSWDYKVVNRASLMGMGMYGASPLKYGGLGSVPMPSWMPNEQSNCVLVTILAYLKGKTGFKKFGYNELKSEMVSIGIDLNHITSNDIFAWVEAFHNETISLHAVSPILKTIKSHIAKNRVVSMMWVINNGHMYTIENSSMQRSIQRAGTTPLNKLQVDELTDKVYFVDELNPAEVERLVDGNINVEHKVVATNMKLTTLSEMVAAKHGMYPMALRKNSSGVTHYLHPISGHLVMYSPEFDLTKALYEYVKGKKPDYHMFNFQNQSATTLANNLYTLLTMKEFLPRSAHTVTDRNINNEHNTVPFYCSLTDDDDPCISNGLVPKKHVAYDVSKCYTNAMLHMQHDYPIFNIFDHWQVYDGSAIRCGEYILRRSVQIGQLGGVPLSQKSILSWNIVEFLLERGYIRQADIGWMRLARVRLPAKYLRDYVAKMQELFADFNYKSYDGAKVTGILVNRFIGSLGKRYKNKNYGFITSDFDMVCGMFYHYSVKESNMKVRLEPDYNEQDGLYYVGLREQTAMDEDRAPYWRQIVNQGKIEVLRLLERVMGPMSELKYLKTDCVGVSRPVEVPLITVGNRQYIGDCLQPEANPYDVEYKYRVDEWHKPLYRAFGSGCIEKLELYTVAPWQKVPCFTFVEATGEYYLDGRKCDATLAQQYDKLNRSKSMCVTGAPGTGKSMLANLLSDSTTERVTSTNKAARSLDAGKPEDVARTKTLDSKFFDTKTHFKRQTTRAIVDEVFSCPEKWLRKLYFEKVSRPDLQFVMFGDPNQCPPPTNLFYVLLDEPVFREICGSRIMEKQYIEGVSRYPKERKEVLDYIMTQNEFPDILKQYPPKPDRLCHITRYRRPRQGVVTAHSINESMIQKHGWKKVMALRTVNNIVKGEVYDVVKNRLDKSMRTEFQVQVHGKVVAGWYRKEFFEPGFAASVNKFQGTTIREPHNIWNTAHMTKDAVYTALSRGSGPLSDTGIEWTDKKFEPQQSAQTVDYELLPVIEAGIIYEARNHESQVVYVGHTTQDLWARHQQHLSVPSDVYNQYPGTWHPKMITKVLTTVLSADDDDLTHCRKELEMVERSFIAKYINEDSYRMVENRHSKTLKDQPPGKSNPNAAKPDKLQLTEFDIDEELTKSMFNVNVNEKVISVRPTARGKALGAKQKKIGYVKCGQEEAMKQANAYIHEFIRRKVQL